MDAKATGSALPLYGADEFGLICGWRFVAANAPQPIESLAAAGAVDAAPGSFVWIHLNLSHAGAQPWLRAHTPLGDTFFEAWSSGSRSTRIERDGDALFAVINDVTFDFSFDAGDVATLWVWVTETMVVTARLHPLRSVDRLRTAIKNGETLESSVALLDHLLNDQADELQQISRKTAERLDDVEDAMLAGHHDRHSAQLAGLRRLMVRLQRLLAPEPSAMTRTLSRPPRWVAERDVALLLRTNDEFALVLRDIGVLQERVKLLQDESATRVAEENNRSLFILTMVTVLALPINLIAGLMGMNVGGVPFADQRHGFWMTLGLIALLTGAVAWLVTWRLRHRRR
jgi:zinc transporter